MSEEPIKRDEKGRWVEGNPPGPGRPKGKTIKERVLEWLEENPDDMKAFVEHFVKKNKELAWRMLEGNPPQPLVGGNEDWKPIQIVFKKDNESTPPETTESV